MYVFTQAVVIEYLLYVHLNTISVSSSYYNAHMTFATHSVWFCLINLLNKDTRSTTIMERVNTYPFLSFKFYLKTQVFESYK